jgi:hypothetical protein
VITEAFQQLAGLFSRRFFFNALLPTFVFASLTTGVVALSGAHGPDVETWWGRLDLLTRILVALVYLALIYFLSAAVASQWRNIVRVFEGYPLRSLPERWQRRLGQQWHLDRMAELTGSDKGNPIEAYYKYPMTSGPHILPTRLGNILLAGERYASSRYGVDTIFFWPRLYPLLPAEFQRDYSELIIYYQFPLVVAFEAAVATAVCSVALAIAHVSVLVFLAVLLSGTAIAYGAYVLSLSSAKEMAEKQRAAFDLYRDLLLAAWPAVRDVTDQEQAFSEIGAFVVMGAPSDWEEPRDRFMRRRRETAPQGEPPAQDPSQGPA